MRKALPLPDPARLSIHKDRFDIDVHQGFAAALRDDCHPARTQER
jgi:hypothetical protein